MKTYFRFFLSVLISIFGLVGVIAQGNSGANNIPVSTYIVVDQFGYRCFDQKTAVLIDPQQGFNAQDEFVPGKNYQVRVWDTDSVVFSGTPVVWNGGNIDPTSGDRGWWFDFSPVTTPGEYYIYDVEKGVRSYPFRIAPDVYKEVLAAATRMFYYQREFTRKEAVYAGSAWTEEPWFLQDTVTRDVNDRNNASKFRDMRGGWMDAGDVNKYVTFCYQPIHQLLTAYELNPGVFTDATNIPESGNGIPDILDEIRFEMQWMMRMQDMSDGGVHIKMGNIDYNDAWPLSTDTRPRYYGPKCSSSSIAAAGMFAHASIVFSKISGWKSLADTLKNRAQKAWAWYKSNPRSNACDDGTIKSGDADWDLAYQDRAEVVAGIYLYMLTGESQYHNAVKSNYSKTRPFTDVTWSMYDAPEGDALLLYTTLPGADPAVKNAILSRKTSVGNSSAIFFPGEDLYNAWVPLSSYHWGSLNPRACIGNTNMDFINYRVDSANHQRYRNRALNILHYFHGVNPFNMVYLSNMAGYGAERSVMKIYHAWYRFGTPLAGNPAPGYVPGGPNKDYGGNLTSLKNQPPQKCFLEFNDGWPANSWEITEPAIYYQSAYVELLSHFIGEECTENVIPDSIVLSMDSLSMKQTSSAALQANVYPATVCNKFVKWIVADTSIAEIDAGGVVTGKKEGNTFVVAVSYADQSITDTCFIKVIPCVRTAWENAPVHLPGRIEAENFDIGCGVEAYYDKDASNNGGKYRTEGVDIETCSEGGYNIGWVEKDEWMEYTVDVDSACDYVAEFRVAAQSAQGAVELFFSSGPVSSGTVSFTPTGGWQTWKTVKSSPFFLQKGQQVMRLIMKTSLFNINYVDLILYDPSAVAESSVSYPFLYPNPAIDECRVSFSGRDAMQSINVFDCTGRLVYSVAFPGAESVQIPIREFAGNNSFFMVKIRTNQHVYYQKLMVIN